MLEEIRCEIDSVYKNQCIYSTCGFFEFYIKSVLQAFCWDITNLTLNVKLIGSENNIIN